MRTTDPKLHSMCLEMSNHEWIIVELWAVIAPTYVVQIFLDKKDAIARMKQPAPPSSPPLVLVKLTGSRERAE